MRERVRRFNGEVHIDSNRSGTRIVVFIPTSVPNAASAAAHAIRAQA
jgi:signal transduction histidine kinase